MSYYKVDRIERKNRRKAIVITAMLYLGALALWVSNDSETWKEYMPFAEYIFDQKVESDATVVASVEEIRP